MVLLGFGALIERKPPLTNLYVNEEARLFDTEFVIHILHGAWRLQTDVSVICSSTSSNHEGGRMVDGLNQLIGQHISDVQLSLPAHDLGLTFENGMTLLIFCDQANEVDEFDNYTCLINGEYFAVNHVYDVVIESGNK